jgi:hypothetical protein
VSGRRWAWGIPGKPSVRPTVTGEECFDPYVSVCGHGGHMHLNLDSRRSDQGMPRIPRAHPPPLTHTSNGQGTLSRMAATRKHGLRMRECASRAKHTHPLPGIPYDTARGRPSTGWTSPSGAGIARQHHDETPAGPRSRAGNTCMPEPCPTQKRAEPVRVPHPPPSPPAKPSSPKDYR